MKRVDKAPIAGAFVSGIGACGTIGNMCGFTPSPLENLTEVQNECRN